jgi:predicted N-acyltransferase
MTAARLKIVEDLSAIAPEQWNRVAGEDPFLSHAYLFALQESGCAVPRFGWKAQYLTLWDERTLTAAMPLYLKMNSFGEHVFDFAWADAYRRSGIPYYPKLVGTVPFTPVTGHRLLGRTREARASLLNAALDLARDTGVSSLHCLFLHDDDVEVAKAQGMMLRQDVQFHWHNHGYRDFEDFLGQLTREKRKNIRHERRKVREAGIDLHRITGENASPEDWTFFASCYAHSREKHFSPPALNEDFFQRLGATLPRNTLLVIATRNGRPIGSAMNVVTPDVLYGRSWGALEFVPGLHFEACYYQAIEFCIERGIKTFEGGAQGEHKLARGFLPVITRSAHWLRHPQFSNAVGNYLQHETASIVDYVDELNERNPFKRG